MDDKSIERWKKFFSVLTGLALMFVSIYFSNLGFGFETNDSSLWLIGIILAISITVIELVFNGQLQYNKQNFTIYVIGIFAYMYGVSTNVMGFWSAQSVVVNSFKELLAVRPLFGMLLGIFLEIAPEVLIVYGLIGISDVEGDFIGALLNTFGQRPNRKPQNNNSQPNYQQQNTPNQRPVQNSNRSVNNNNSQRKPPSSQQSPSSRMRDWEQDGRQQPQYRPLGASSQKDDERERYRNES